MDVINNELISTLITAVLQFIGEYASKIGAGSSGTTELCSHPFVHNRAPQRFEALSRQNLFGQDLAIDVTVRAIESHLRDDNPQKALVLSFHGWTGCGKTYMAEQLINAIYKEGSVSNFVTFYISSVNFPDPTQVMEYQEELRKIIKEKVKICPRTLFIFDEVDLAPAGVFDVLVPYIHHPGKILDGQNYKKSIFLFMSNVGEDHIFNITLKAWMDGRPREDLTFRDFERELSNEALLKKGQGLYKSRMIERVLVDYFVPFLPLEEKHVMECIKAEAVRQQLTLNEDEIKSISGKLLYRPDELELFSHTGCKTVHSRVKYFMTEKRMRLGVTGYDIHDAKNEL